MQPRERKRYQDGPWSSSKKHERKKREGEKRKREGERTQVTKMLLFSSLQ